MKKKLPARDLFKEIEHNILKAKITLLAHYGSSKDFGINIVAHLRAEYEPLIRKQIATHQQAYYYAELDKFEHWCADKRREIIGQYYKDETNE